MRTTEEIHTARVVYTDCILEIIRVLSTLVRLIVRASTQQTAANNNNIIILLVVLH